MSTPYRVIKKYKNRRLYDLEISKYITVDDLSRYVIEGVPFQVVTASNGQDITNATLLQILVEMNDNSAQFLSSDMLRQLITMAHHPMNDALKSMLGQMLLMMENKLPPSLDLSGYQKAADIWSKQSDALLKQWLSIFNISEPRS